MTYRILTEDKDRKGIVAILKRKFDAFSIIPMLGYWKGIGEKSLAIEIDTDRENDVRAIADEVKTRNHQEAVLVQRIESVSQLV